MNDIHHIPAYEDGTDRVFQNVQQIPCQVTQVFQMQLLVIQFTIKMFHIGFMQVLILQSLKSLHYKIFC